jgi:6-phosphogluconolactonase/glucosamine-6-phosphate isomerase/deaminase
VLWLVSGGSNVPLTVAIMRSLPADIVSRLTVALSDERYGKPGHPDSNRQQLLAAGFQAGSAQVIETLQAELTLEDTRVAFDAALHTAIAAADITIAQLGIGGDGHIAGILPQSAGLAVDRWVAAYEAAAYKRITITPPVFNKLQAAYVFVYGDTKKGALERLSRDLPASDQPAQLLKRLAEAYVYTDQVVPEDQSS